MSATVPIRPVGYSRVVRASQEEIAKFAKVSTYYARVFILIYMNLKNDPVQALNSFLYSDYC